MDPFEIVKAGGRRFRDKQDKIRSGKRSNDGASYSRGAVNQEPLLTRSLGKASGLLLDKAHQFAGVFLSYAEAGMDHGTVVGFGFHP